MTTSQEFQRFMARLRCPSCKAGKLEVMNAGPSMLVCRSCAGKYPFLADNAVSVIRDISDTKQQIQEFWGDMCDQWYSGFDRDITKDVLYHHLNQLEDMFTKRRHLAVNEMPIRNLTGKDVLEIGCGGGGHASLFKRAGACIVASDITKERCLSTAKKFGLIEEGWGMVLQGDAENLPFEDASFDIVYSNGVLHHSQDTEACVTEVERVLRPGGLAVIMLYCRSSILYWLKLLTHTLLNGSFFTMPEAHALGRVTEGKPSDGGVENPITRVYNRDEIGHLFRKFESVALRKNSFALSDVPLLGKIRPWLLSLMGQRPHEGGVIVYGHPYWVETSQEIAMGKHLGFGWNILAKKRDEYNRVVSSKS